MDTIHDFVVAYGGISDPIVSDVVSGMIVFALAVLAVGCFCWFLDRSFKL